MMNLRIHKHKNKNISGTTSVGLPMLLSANEWWLVLRDASMTSAFFYPFVLERIFPRWRSTMQMYLSQVPGNANWHGGTLRDKNNPDKELSKCNNQVSLAKTEAFLHWNIGQVPSLRRKHWKIHQRLSLLIYITEFKRLKPRTTTVHSHHKQIVFFFFLKIQLVTRNSTVFCVCPQCFYTICSSHDAYV